MAEVTNSESTIHSFDNKEVKDEQEEIIFDFDDEEIVEMAKEGHGPREIAREFGIDPSRVVQITKEQKEKAITNVEEGQMAPLNNSETTIHKSNDEEVILDLSEEDDLEELEKEVIEEIEQENRAGEKNSEQLQPLISLMAPMKLFSQLPELFSSLIKADSSSSHQEKNSSDLILKPKHPSQYLAR